MGLDAGLSSLDLFIVNFELFCADANSLECPESSKNLLRRGVIRLRAARLRRDEWK